MFPYKKIFQPREFLPTLSNTKPSWHLLLVNLGALVVSVLVASLAFGGVSNFFRVLSHLSVGYGAVIVFFIIFALVRILFIRCIIVLGIGYVLQEYSEKISAAGIRMWKIVNLYFYAYLLVLCAQIGIEVLVLIVPKFIAAPVDTLALWVIPLFDVVTIVLTIYWVGQEIKKPKIISAQKITQDSIIENNKNAEVEPKKKGSGNQSVS